MQIDKKRPQEDRKGEWRFLLLTRWYTLGNICIIVVDQRYRIASASGGNVGIGSWGEGVRASSGVEEEIRANNNVVARYTQCRQSTGVRRSGDNAVGVAGAAALLLVGGDRRALGDDAVGVARASALLPAGGDIDDDGGGGGEGVHLCVCVREVASATGDLGYSEGRLLTGGKCLEGMGLDAAAHTERAPALPEGLEERAYVAERHRSGVQ